MKERGIEVKVGILIVVSLILLGVFIYFLGDFRVKRDMTIFIDFQQTIDLKPGAPVKINGVNAGRVESIDFWGGKLDETLTDEDMKPVYGRTDKHVWIRVKCTIDKAMGKTVHKNAEPFITTQGLLGEKYIEIAPGSFDFPPIEDEVRMKGTDPPRMDQMIANLSKVLRSVGETLDKDPDLIFKILVNANKLLEHVDLIVVENRQKITEIVDDVTALSKKMDKVVSEADKALVAVNNAIGKGEEIKETIADIRHITSTLRGDIKPIVGKMDRILTKGETLVDDVNQTVVGLKSQVDGRMKQVAEILSDVKVMTGNVREGHGLVGAVINDHEIYEDLKEFLKELKRNPWRIIWKQ